MTQTQAMLDRFEQTWEHLRPPSRWRRRLTIVLLTGLILYVLVRWLDRSL